MQQIYITQERLKLFRKNPEWKKSIEKACKCKIAISPEDTIEITSADAIAEFTAKNIVYAYGRGFDMEVALTLTDPEFYFKLIDLKLIESKPERVKQIKARVIGINGKTKRYIEEVTMAKISIYGDTVGLIGDIIQVSEAETALNTIIDGGTHRLAYIRMEAMHRKNKADATSAKF